MIAGAATKTRIERLQDRDDINWDAGRQLHAGRAVAQEAEQQRSQHHPQRMAVAQQGQGNAVKAIAGGESHRQVVVHAQHFVRACHPGQRAGQRHGQDDRR